MSYVGVKKVSVIIPVYNAEQYISETLESIIFQTYRNLEIIVIDDGSTDNTKEFVIDFSKKDKRVKYFYQTNKGPASARNLGIKKSIGEYIAFCDADDIWALDKLEKQLKVFEKNDIGLVYTGIKLFGSKEGEFLPTSKNSPKKLFLNNYIPNSSVLIKKYIFDKFGYLNEDKKYFSVEDYEYWLRISLDVNFSSILEPLVFYRVHLEQISKNTKKTYLRLIKLYKSFLFNPKFYRYWHLCLWGIIKNGIQYIRSLSISYAK